jgi:hypothetical protein
MPTVAETVADVIAATSWGQRVARIRLIPQRHGTAEHQAVHAAIARAIYVPQLAPDFAYVHEAPFYDLPYFAEVYAATAAATADFTRTAAADLAGVIKADPRSLLVLRTILGLTRSEFAHSTTLAAAPAGRPGLTAAKIDGMERGRSMVSAAEAEVVAGTITTVMAGSLFGEPPGELKSKQAKPDTAAGWDTVAGFARDGVPYPLLLHQRHYGGAFRQVLDATSTLRGDLIEDAVEALFSTAGVPYLRTGSQNQAEIVERFEIVVQPAPDFVVYDAAGALRAMLECKGANDGGTARDKALRFQRLREESVRLGGVPLMAVLGGIGWARVNDTLGPVVRDTDGRVFTLADLGEMLTVAPFPTLVGTAN